MIKENYMKDKRLYKIEDGKMVAGVAGGLAEYFDIDPTIVRVVWGLLCCAYGTGLVAYIICAFVFPEKSSVVKETKKTKK